MSRTVMIGDTTHDMQMAGNAGAAAISVHYGAHPATELAEHAPLFGAESISELHDWLSEHA
jgi:phosphoglycolate phosphatase